MTHAKIGGITGQINVVPPCCILSNAPIDGSSWPLDTGKKFAAQNGGFLSTILSRHSPENNSHAGYRSPLPGLNEPGGPHLTAEYDCACAINRQVAHSRTRVRLSLTSSRALVVISASSDFSRWRSGQSEIRSSVEAKFVPTIVGTIGNNNHYVNAATSDTVSRDARIIRFWRIWRFCDVDLELERERIRGSSINANFTSSVGKSFGFLLAVESSRLGNVAPRQFCLVAFRYLDILLASFRRSSLFEKESTLHCFSFVTRRADAV